MWATKKSKSQNKNQDRASRTGDDIGELLIKEYKGLLDKVWSGSGGLLHSKMAIIKNNGLNA